MKKPLPTFIFAHPMEPGPPFPDPPAGFAGTPEAKPPGIRAASLCPCKSRLPYNGCCEPFHHGKAQPKTAEALMRSRYSAWFFGRIDYLVETTHPDSRHPQLRLELQSAADGVRFKFLTILACSKGQAEDKTGKVEFVAQYYLENELREHHEVSRFRRSRGLWKYLDAKG